MKSDDYGYDFFEDAEEMGGIFARTDDPFGSYGDKDAITDLKDEYRPLPIQGTLGMDGLTQPTSPVDGLAILNSSARVSEDELICLVGECCHYVEVVQQVGELLVTLRRCTHVQNWAEAMKLDDVVVLGCNQHHPLKSLTLDQQRRIALSDAHVRRRNENARKVTRHTLGVCHEASCLNYHVMVVRGVDESGNPALFDFRYCTKLGGAARPFMLNINEPILGCNHVVYTAPRDALHTSQIYLETERGKHARKRGQAGPRAGEPAVDAGGTDGVHDPSEVGE